MAVIKNHKITATLRSAVSYILNDKTEKEYGIEKDVNGAIAYAMNDKEGTITYTTRRSTLNCSPGEPVKSFERLINRFGWEEMERGNRQTKDGKPVIAWHYIQSFDSKVDPEIAHEIGRKFAAEMFPGHPVVIGTHTNTEHTHNHFIICAWTVDGHKWHQHNRAYQQAREVSDRLCDEYGLGVLENTRRQKLVRWTDKDGNIHYYEPTDRKNGMLTDRDGEELSRDRIGSYRNTTAYDAKENEKLSNREIIRRDIDRLLPAAQSYDHLLNMLRQTGYKIRAKKADGTYLQYVSFTPPTAERGARDSSLSGDGYYRRENLEKVIAEFVKNRQESFDGREATAEDIPYVEEYVYGVTDFAKVSDDFRLARNENGGYYRVPRGEAEKLTLESIRGDDRNVRGLIDTARLRELVERQSRYGGGADYISDKKAGYLISRLKESCKALTVMEHENLYSLNQINREVAGLWAQYNAALNKVNELEASVSRLEQILAAPEQAASIRQRMKNGSAEYNLMERGADRDALRESEAVIRRYKLNDPKEIASLQEKAAHARERADKMRTAMDEQKKRLADFELCAKVLGRIDREHGRTVNLREYRQISREGRKGEKNDAQRNDDGRRRY